MEQIERGFESRENAAHGDYCPCAFVRLPFHLVFVLSLITKVLRKVLSHCYTEDRYNMVIVLSKI